MKNFRFFIILLVFLINIQSAQSATISEAAEFFNYFTSLSNSYSTELFQFYSPNAIIKRILIKNDGSKEEFTLQTHSYLKKLKLYSKIAGIKGYKNIYQGVTYKKHDGGFLISGYRTPTTNKTEKFPFSYLITQTASGKWVILEDITQTKNAALLK